MVMGLLILVALIGCATIERGTTLDTEQLLAASGFKMKPADTPEKLANLQTHPQRQLVSRVKDGRTIYSYADASTCKCLYVGGEKAYQRYQKLAVEKQIAADRLRAAQMNQEMEMDWGMWGPWGYDWPME
jgi:hypothetical protein